MEAGVHELTAGYALDALSPEERRAFEEHLEGCERCQEELQSFWETTEALAVAASGPEPSANLRDRILADARAERQTVVPFVSRRQRAVPAIAAVAAVAAVIALAIGIWGLQVSSDLDDARLALDREREAAAILADPDGRDVSLELGQGRVVVAPDGRAVLVLDELANAPSRKTYVAWIIEGGTPIAAAAFAGRDDRDVVGLEGEVDPGDVVAVTVEDRLVQAPTTQPIVRSAPA